MLNRNLKIPHSWSKKLAAFLMWFSLLAIYLQSPLSSGQEAEHVKVLNLAAHTCHELDGIQVQYIQAATVCV